MYDYNSKKSLRNYLLFFIGQQFSILGSNIVQFTIIVWITVETQSELYLSLAAFLGFGPQVLFTLVGGVFADKANKKYIIGIMDTFQAIITLLLIFIVKYNLSNLLIYILLLTGLRGVFNAFHQPATRALIPLMVPKDKLSKINSLIGLITSIMLTISPALAGFLLIYFKLHEVMWVDIITWIIALISLIIIKIPKIAKSTEGSKEKSTFFHSFKEGMTFIRKLKGFLSFIIVASLLNFFGVCFGVLIPSYILLDNQGSKQVFGFLSALLQAGIVISSLILIFTNYFRENKIKLIILFWYIELAGLFFIALSPSFFVHSTNLIFIFIGVGLFVFGLTSPFINVLFITFIQRIVPLDMQGRIISVVLTFVNILTPLGMILAGVIAEIISTQVLFIISISLSFLVLTCYWLFGINRRIFFEINCTSIEKI